MSKRKVKLSIGLFFLVFVLILIIDPRVKEFESVDKPKVITSYEYKDAEEKRQELKSQFGSEKYYPEQFELAILSALTHYPELVDTKISFELVDSGFPLTSRPDVWSLLNSFGARSYTIRISKDMGNDQNDFLLQHHSFNKQVGVIGHELAHVVTYETSLPYQVAGFGFGYALSSYRAKFERATDVRTIEHGLGHQLLDWNSGFYEVAPKSITKYYLSPEEIQGMMDQLAYY